MSFPRTKHGILEVVSVIIEAIIVIALEAYAATILFKYFNDTGGLTGPQKGLPVYITIFGLAQIFQIGLSWDAVINQNTIQIIGVVLFNLSICGYSIFQYVTLKDVLSDGSSGAGGNQTLNKVLMVIPIVVGIFQVVFIYLAVKLYMEFGWKIYKKIGADPHMRQMYRFYQIFLMLLKLDVFFVFGFGIQFLVLVIDPTDPEFGLTIAALPIMMAILALAVYGIKREDKWITILFIIGLLLALAYFIFKIVRMYTPSQESKYMFTRRYLTFFASLSLVVVVLTLGNAVMCLNNFNKGLRQHIISNRDVGTELGSPARKAALDDDDDD